MSESTSLYIPGQKLADSWTLYPALGTYAPQPEDSGSEQISLSGVEQRRTWYPKGGRLHFPFRTMSLSQIQARDFWELFVKEIQGSFAPFYFFRFDEEYFSNVVVGTADGSANLQIPFTGTNDGAGLSRPADVKDNGVSILYGMTSNFGTGREDRITGMFPIPTAGHTITATFYGRQRFVCRQFGRPTMSFFNGGATGKPRPMWDLHPWQVL
jgi:hypothetical protein